MSRLAIIGGGTMGRGIAALFCARQWAVDLVEPQEDRRRAVPKLVADLMREMGSDEPIDALNVVGQADHVSWDQVALVIETAYEDLAVKKKIFQELDRLCPDTVPLASNSSAIPISLIAEGLKGASRALGLHFFMPAQLVPAVEVISGKATSADVVERVCEIMKAVHKKPVRVKRDVPGFLANRIQHALMREAIALVEEGFATAEDVDTAVRYGFGLRYIAAGPLLQKDLAGVDIHYAAAKTMYPFLHDNKEPSSYMKSLVDNGETGVKCEKLKGFYKWTREGAQREQARYDRILMQALKLLEDEETSE